MSASTTLSASSKLEGEYLVSSLRQLIRNWEPYIRDSEDVEQTEESIIRMEENDENFHKYEIVKNIRSVMEENLGRLIEDEIEKSSAPGQEQQHHRFGQDSLVRRITDRIITSKEYAEMMRRLKTNTVSALDHIHENFEEEILSNQKSSSSGQNAPVKRFYSFSTSDGESSFGSSLNQSSFMFMNHEQFQAIYENLDKKKKIEVRREALASLSQFPPLELQGSDQWNMLKAGILDALADPDEQLSNMALKFCARGFSSTSPNTREIYTTLLEYLMFQFNTRKSTIPKVKNGIDTKQRENSKLLRAFRLMSEFDHHIPSYWVRFSGKFLEDVHESTLMLLSIHHTSPVGGPSQMSPMHFLALMDPKATWFIKWLHGSYSRQPLLKMLTKYRSIVDNITRHCLDYALSRKNKIDISEMMSRASIADGQRTHYTGAELEYIYFVHSITMLGRLLFFADGRSFFPAKLREREEPVTIVKLLVSIISLLGDPVSVFHARLANGVFYDPATLVAEVLKKLSSGEASLDLCLCKDEVTNALLMPISCWLKGSHESYDPALFSDYGLLLIADVLSAMAGSNRGRQHLLYGEGCKRFTKSESCAAHLISEFAKRALQDDLPEGFGSAPSKPVIGSFVYICRQLYNNCEGLHFMYKYDLHQVIAVAWRTASRDADLAATPTPSSHNSDDTSTIKESHDIIMWEDTLRDNLLNFAATPKGLLLLQLTGATNECVSYMYTRYAKKLQVSKCEKFGYGTMLTQVASTSPGMAALQNTGFVKALLGEMWSILECADEFKVVYTPKTWPVQPIDRAAHKPLVSLLNLLSSYPAVYEVLAGQVLPSKAEYNTRERPSTIVDLLDRLVMVDTQAKVRSLFNYEQSHVFGLRLLSALISCLDTFLLLETQFKFMNYLLADQTTNVSESDSPAIIIDMLSVERNYILVKGWTIGGPSERILPSKNLLEDKGNPYPFPMVTKFPIPRDYLPTMAGRTALKTDNELGKLLLDTRKGEHGPGWFEKCKKAFCSILTTKPDQAKGGLLQDLLDKSVVVIAQSKEDAIFPLVEYSASEQVIKSQKLSAVQQQGIHLATRYGLHLKILNASNTAQEKFSSYMKTVQHFLHQQQKPNKACPYRFQQGDYPGFDWFAATIFLMMNGHKERAWKVLHKISCLIHSAYLWMRRLHNSAQLSPEIAASGIPPVCSATGHHIELLLQAEVPGVSSAFRMSGYTPSQICQHWVRQCFWSYLDWMDICHYVLVCLIMGVDYQVYICVAILKHLQPDILLHMQHQNLILFLKETPIKGFKVGDYLEFMQQLEKKYRHIVLPDIRQLRRA
ncbi:protein broad-minded-like isoform X2 [Lineus longissimus]|uniref:protein broad-minded-like isoform X2 n=1 Tax=Lineus longissimus TaxID=88925 RepID=UPI00315CDA42